MRNVISLYGLQVAQYVLPWLTFPYLTRTLGVEKFGLIVYAQSVVQYFNMITDFGFNFTATREISIHRDDPVKLSRIYSATMAAKTLLMLTCLMVMTAVVWSVPRFRAEAPLYFVSFVGVVATVIFPQWLFQGLEKMQYITVREISTRLLALFPIFFLVHGPGDYIVAAAIQAGSLLLAGVACFIGFKRMTSARFVPVTWREIRHTLAEGWHVFLSTAAINLYTTSNTVVLGLLAPDAVVGYFGGARKLVDAARALVFPLTTAIFPHFSRLSNESPEAGLAFIRRNAIRLTAPFALLSLALLAGAPLLTRFVLGRRFGPSVPLLQLMAPIPFAVSIGAIYATYYMLGMGYKKEWSRLIISAAILNFALLGPLLLVFSPAVAVSIVSTAVEVWVALGSYWYYRRTRLAVLEKAAAQRTPVK